MLYNWFMQRAIELSGSDGRRRCSSVAVALGMGIPDHPAVYDAASTFLGAVVARMTERQVCSDFG